MNPTPKPVSISVRPWKVSHLCFEVDGIVDMSNAELGAQVKAFPFSSFYATLGASPTVSGDLSRLLYDFLQIEAAVAQFTLVTLRREARKAALNKAINARQNAYFAKYGNQAAIIALMNQYFSPGWSGPTRSKPQLLSELVNMSQQQWDGLRAAYTSDARTGVVKTTSSALTSTTNTKDTSSTQTNDTSTTNTKDTSSTQTSGTLKGTTTTFSQDLHVPNISGPVKIDAPKPGDYPGFIGDTGSGPFDQSIIVSESGDNSQSSGSDQTQSSGSLQTEHTGSSSESQTIVNTDYGYRMPYVEGQAQYLRAQISLIDQQFGQFMSGQNLPNLDQVFRNELQSVDGDVFRLQMALLNTILMSPISGTVTGVYKHPGDAVKAGEPVLRVEDNSAILLMARLKYPAPIVIGSSVTVSTRLFDSSSQPNTVTGSVVSARGHRDDDEWDIIVKCVNPLDASSKPTFPFGYRFDYDDTTVSIS
jgi:biotin carboxyl carrier protein